MRIQVATTSAPSRYGNGGTRGESERVDRWGHDQFERKSRQPQSVTTNMLDDDLDAYMMKR